MARFIFFSIPLFGHVNYGLKLAKALSDRGHEVRYYCGNAYKDYICEKGIDYYPYDNDIEFLFSESKSTYSPEYMLEVKPEDVDYVSEIYKYSYHLHEIESIILKKQEDEIASFRPDVIVYDSAAIWGKKIARVLNIPCVCSCTPYSYPRELIFEKPEMFSKLILHQDMSREMTLKIINKMNTLLKKRFLLSDEFPISENWCGNGDINILYTVKEFQMGSKYFDDSKNAFCGILIDKDDENDVENYISKSNRKIVYIAFGTIYNNWGLLHDITEQLRTICEYDFILNIGLHNNTELFNGLPSNWKVVTHVPQLSLLQKVDAFITHGGVNSVREAAYYGVPMIVIPWEGDTLCTAKDVEIGGYGKIVNPFEMDKLKKTLVDLMKDKNIKEKCNNLSRKMQNAGGLHRAVRIIEKIEIGNLI